MSHYLSVAQVADLTGYSRATVRTKFNDGTLPGHRVNGGHWRAVESEIKAAIEGRGVATRNARLDASAIARAALDSAAVEVARKKKRAERLAQRPQHGAAQPQEGGG